MQLKVQDIIIDAMNLIGVIAINETPSSAEMQVGLRTLNMMLDRWSANRLMLRSTSSAALPLTAGKYIYTIGAPTSDFTSSKPLRLENVFMRDNNGVDYSIDILPQSAYDALQDKSYNQSVPAAVYYDPGATQQAVNEGTFYVYPIPDAALLYTLHIDYDEYLTEFSTLTAIITFDPAYYEALVYGLAVRLYRRYHTDTAKSIPEDIIAMSAAALKTIENMNSVQARASMDIPGKVSTFNIFTGDYN